MSTYTDVELPVEGKEWRFRMNKARMGNRRRIEGDIAIRWLRRFVERTASTITADPYLALSEDHADYFLRNQVVLQVQARLILGGRRFGLPERLSTDAQMVTVPVPDDPEALGPERRELHP